MATTKITKRAVDALENGATVWDSELRGFGCRKSAKGVATFVLKYRVNGRQRWLTLGQLGGLTPITARDKAMKAKADIVDGRDPADEKAVEKARASLAEFYDRYLADYSLLQKKPSSRDADRYHWGNHIAPNLGIKRMDQITREDVAKLHTSLGSTPYTANRVLSLLRHMFTMAQRWGVLPDGTDPTRHVAKYAEKKRERFLSSEEVTRLGAVLTAVEADGESPYVVAALRLLVLTGARLSEILTLEWEWVDLEGRALRLPDNKTNVPKIIHLNAPAIAALSEISRQADNPHVICGAKRGAHLVNLQKPWRRIRKAAGLDDVRIHDLRHSFASVAVSGGMSLPVIGALLGHTQAQTTLRYAHLADDPLKAASDRVAGEIGALLDGGGAEIVSLPSSKKG